LRKALGDDLEHRQLRTIDALCGEIVGPHGFRSALLQQGGDLFLGDRVRRRRSARSGLAGHYCTTKLVNSRSSTSSPPCFFCTARISASASSRSFSLPSRDISV